MKTKKYRNQRNYLHKYVEQKTSQFETSQLIQSANQFTGF